MFGIEKLDLTFSFSPVLFFAGILLLTGYSVYAYLYTVPAVTRIKKILLVFLRSAALLLLLFIIFEPVLTIEKRVSFHPVNLIFIDNSRSISIKDGTSREDDVRSFLSGLKNNNLSESSSIYTFSSTVNKTSVDSLDLTFSGGSTNISEIFNAVEKSSENISSVTIVGDGVITEGQNPVYKAAKLNIPVFTLGIGDSARKKDLLVKDVSYNEYVYSGVKTVISAALLHNGFKNQPVAVTLSENGRITGTKNIILSQDGLQNVEFEYTPLNPGEKKISLTVAGLKGEQSYDNNKKVFFLNVLSSKIKVLLLAGAPSADVSFVKNSLSRDENISLSSIVQTAPGKYSENLNINKAVDSAQIFFFIGFPSAGTDNTLWDKLSGKILREKKPFFLLISDGTDFNKLGKIRNELPFVINEISSGFTEVLPDIDLSATGNPLLQSGGENTAADWNNLPPVFMNNTGFSAKPESEILVYIKIRNIPVKKPLILTRRLGSSKSAAVLAKNIWRWKLQTAVKGSRLFDNFLMNSLKWLNVIDDQKHVIIRTSKKLYSQGEEVLFTAQVYDASFNPVPDAKLVVDISTGDLKTSIGLNPSGNGIYEGSFESSRTGDYLFSGDAALNGKKIGSDKGSFNIGEIDIEMMNPRMDFEFLSLLSNETKGNFFLPENQNRLFDKLRQRIERTADNKIISSEFSLWSNEWLLVLAIMFFAAEWFIRKQSGML